MAERELEKKAKRLAYLRLEKEKAAKEANDSASLSAMQSALASESEKRKLLEAELERLKLEREVRSRNIAITPTASKESSFNPPCHKQCKRRFRVHKKAKEFILAVVRRDMDIPWRCTAQYQGTRSWQTYCQNLNPWI